MSKPAPYEFISIPPKKGESVITGAKVKTSRDTCYDLFAIGAELQINGETYEVTQANFSCGGGYAFVTFDAKSKQPKPPAKEKTK